MFTLLKYLSAGVVFGVVLSGVFHGPCCHAVFTDTVGGLMVGVLHGLLHVYRIRESSKRGGGLTLRRMLHVIIHDVRMDMVIGLLIGVATAVLGMCKG